MPNNFIERPRKNEKDDAVQYVKRLLESARTENRNKDIEKLEEVIRLLHTKKYGLVWEEHSEIVEEEMKTKIPVFIEDREKKIVGNPDSGDFNFLLEGDNLHCLHLLEKTHSGNIDIIYIDPPYNTENSLSYNDSRVSTSDSYRHSKWLSFMERRLIIASRLLSEQGLIFISIDDNEGYNLKVLCDEIFGESNFMGSFSVTKAEGGGQAKFIVKGHDLLLIYAKNLSIAKPLGRPKDIRGKIFERDGEQYWIQEDAYRKVFGDYGNLHYEEILQYKDQKFKDKIDDKIKSGEVILIDKGDEGHIIGKVRKISDDYSKYHSVLKQLNADGKNDLKAFGLDSEFDYPKPVDLVKELISGASFLRPGKLTVLDFFAGSGTTGQSALEFIKESGRNDIKFILCTNNEISSKQKLEFVKSLGYLKDYRPAPKASDSSIEKKISTELEEKGTSLLGLIEENPQLYDSFGICQSVTYPRIKKTINGFEAKQENKKILYKKKINEENIFCMPSFLEEIEQLKEETGYKEYKLKIDESSNLVLESKIQETEMYQPIPSNLKYFKTAFVDKMEFPDIALERELLNYITPLVELEFGVDISNPTVQIVLSEDRLEELISEEELEIGATLFIHPDVFLDTAAKRALSAFNVTIQEIPDYFFGKELWS